MKRISRKKNSILEYAFDFLHKFIQFNFTLIFYCTIKKRIQTKTIDCWNKKDNGVALDDA